MKVGSIILHRLGNGSTSLLSLHTYQVVPTYVGGQINEFLESLIVAFTAGCVVSY